MQDSLCIILLVWKVFQQLELNWTSSPRTSMVSMSQSWVLVEAGKILRSSIGVHSNVIMRDSLGVLPTPPYAYFLQQQLEDVVNPQKFESPVVRPSGLDMAPSVVAAVWWKLLHKHCSPTWSSLFSISVWLNVLRVCTTHSMYSEYMHCGEQRQFVAYSTHTHVL